MQSILSGSWGEDVRWEVFQTNKLPPQDLTTATFCVAITKNNEIVVARSKRGWGLLGGHIEEGETVLQALERESIEEGGFIPKDPQLFAVMQVTANKPVLRPGSTTQHHPFPTSYLVYYYAKTSQPIKIPTGAEILEAKSLSLAAIEKLQTPDFEIIKLGYMAYLRSK